MKKFIIGLGIVVAIIGGVYGVSKYVQHVQIANLMDELFVDEGAEGTASQVEIDNLMESLRVDSTGSKYKRDSNVGNGEEYSYKVTEIIGDEIHGVAIDKVSSDNAGIFLYASEVSFDVQIGDNLVVVWGAEEDVFKSIEKY